MSTDLERIERKVDFILSVLVVQQKDVVAATGIDPETIRKRAEAGEIELLSRDGSRLNFMTLKTAYDLKQRKRTYKRKPR